MLDAPPARQALPAAALALAGGAGVAGAVQARVNGELRVALDDALLAAAVSFVGGLLLVGLAVLLRPSSRAALGLLREVPLWQRAAGVGGALLIGVSSAAAPVVGVALLTLGLVAGQTVGGLLVDRAGLGPGGGHPLTGARVAGAALCLGAVALAAPGGAGDLDPVLLGLVLLAGLAIAVGAALNGRIRATTGDAAVTTLLNFAVGLVALLVALAVHTVQAGLPSPDFPGPGQWWLYTGGVLGVVFVSVAAVVVRTLGVLRMSLAIVAGQVLGALALDLLLPLGPVRVGTLTVLGALLTLVAVAVSGLGARR